MEMDFVAWNFLGVLLLKFDMHVGCCLLVAAARAAGGEQTTLHTFPGETVAV